MLISIWGRDGIGKSKLADALGFLFSQNDVTTIIDTDLTQPTLPIRLNGKKFDSNHSLGKAVSGIGTSCATRYLHQHPKKKQLFYAGLTDKDEYLSYEIGLEADNNAQDFIEACKEVAKVVILDLSGQRTDPFVPCALSHSDKIIIPITPNVQGICWYNAVQPLLHTMSTKKSILPVTAMTERSHDLPIVEKAANLHFAAELPFVKEFRQDSITPPSDCTSLPALRYAKQVKKLHSLLKGDDKS